MPWRHKQDDCVKWEWKYRGKTQVLQDTTHRQCWTSWKHPLLLVIPNRWSEIMPTICVYCIPTSPQNIHHKSVCMLACAWIHNNIVVWSSALPLPGGYILIQPVRPCSSPIKHIRRSRPSRRSGGMKQAAINNVCETVTRPSQPDTVW